MNACDHASAARPRAKTRTSSERTVSASSRADSCGKYISPREKLKAASLLRWICRQHRSDQRGSTANSPVAKILRYRVPVVKHSRHRVHDVGPLCLRGRFHDKVLLARSRRDEDQWEKLESFTTAGWHGSSQTLRGAAPTEKEYTILHTYLKLRATYVSYLETHNQARHQRSNTRVSASYLVAGGGEEKLVCLQ